jgi:type IV pilus assembly protein PilA
MAKAFTLIELLVVVAIIGILAAVGVTAYNGFISFAKKNATIANWTQASKFIQNTLARCNIIGGTIQLSASSGSINCSDTSSVSNITAMADVFKNYFLEQGFKNPYDATAPAIIRTGSGGDTIDGRLRLDVTVCPSGQTGNRITLWYKVHDNPDGVIAIFQKDNWCK